MERRWLFLLLALVSGCHASVTRPKGEGLEPVMHFSREVFFEVN